MDILKPRQIRVIEEKEIRSDSSVGKSTDNWATTRKKKKECEKNAQTVTIDRLEEREGVKDRGEVKERR